MFDSQFDVMDIYASSPCKITILYLSPSGDALPQRPLVSFFLCRVRESTYCMIVQ